MADSEQVPDPPEVQLQQFLDTVLSASAAQGTDESWRLLGRGFGFYFLGALQAGLLSEQALSITHSYQMVMVNAIMARNSPT